MVNDKGLDCDVADKLKNYIELKDSPFELLKTIEQNNLIRLHLVSV